MGMDRRRPRKASAAPMVELALSGLTDRALLRLMISATGHLLWEGLQPRGIVFQGRF